MEKEDGAKTAKKWIGLAIGIVALCSVLLGIASTYILDNKQLDDNTTSIQAFQIESTQNQQDIFEMKIMLRVLIRDANLEEKVKAEIEYYTKKSNFRN